MELEPNYYSNLDELFSQLQDMANSPPPKIRIENLKDNYYFDVLQEVYKEQKSDLVFLKHGHNEQRMEMEEKKESLDSNLWECISLDIDEGDEVTDPWLRDVQLKIDDCFHFYTQSAIIIQMKLDDQLKWAQLVLYQQKMFRPIEQAEIFGFLDILNLQGLHWQNELKMVACNQLMLLKSRLYQKRKRRNFTKSATQILNQYFNTHMAQPYPSDGAKAELAKQCGISIAQVSNWFGNKRIRFRKAFLKNKDVNASDMSKCLSNLRFDIKKDI
uniref:Homeobox domain-containing protein n=1 Tax=Ditylenchus dipsaci TaxID=166011 RepID=A0A915EEV6_9BILA